MPAEKTPQLAMQASATLPTSNPSSAPSPVQPSRATTAAQPASKAPDAAVPEESPAAHPPHPGNPQPTVADVGAARQVQPAAPPASSAPRLELSTSKRDSVTNVVPSVVSPGPATLFPPATQPTLFIPGFDDIDPREKGLSLDEMVAREKRDQRQRAREGENARISTLFKHRFLPPPQPKPARKPVPQSQFYTRDLPAASASPPGTSSDEAEQSDLFESFSEPISSYTVSLNDEADRETAETESIEAFKANAKYGWRTDRILTMSWVPDNERHGLIILNQKIDNRQLLARLIQSAGRGLVICADGGANRLYDAYKEEKGEMRKL